MAQFKGTYVEVTDPAEFDAAMDIHVASIQRFGGSVVGKYKGNDYVVTLTMEPEQLKAYQEADGGNLRAREIAELLRYSQSFTRN